MKRMHYDWRLMIMHDWNDFTSSLVNDSKEWLTQMSIAIQHVLTTYW